MTDVLREFGYDVLAEIIPGRGEHEEGMEPPMKTIAADPLRKVREMPDRKRPA